jgi:hypothetical protein
VAEFMKNIVQEVLNRNNSSPSSKKEHHSEPVQRQIERPNKVSVTGEGLSGGGLEAINRPNYQTKNLEKRLSSRLTGVKSEASDIKSMHNGTKRTTVTEPSQQQNSNYDLTSRGFKQGPASELSTLSLVQGNRTSERETLYSNALVDSNKASHPQQIGKTKDGSYVWCFPTVHPGLKPLFRGTIGTNMVGVVTSEKCCLGQLFLVDEVLREIPNLDYHMLWDKDNNQGFVFELYMNDEKHMNQLLREIYQKLNRRALRELESYISVSPSAWLSRHLSLDSSYRAIAVLEGIPYYKSIAILDRYFKRKPELKMNFKIEKENLLLMGESQVISQAIDTLKQEASRY